MSETHNNKEYPLPLTRKNFLKETAIMVAASFGSRIIKPGHAEAQEADEIAELNLYLTRLYNGYFRTKIDRHPDKEFIQKSLDKVIMMNEAKLALL